jgi:3-hydroxyisobutyrate dehydrogenase-like beta-hydroxyacid dehydrogenase
MTRPAVTVAVLGTGTTGAPMSRNLLHAGFEMRVWNRTRAKAAVVGIDARRMSTPRDAASDAEVLITMLADGAAVEQVMTGPKGALSMLPDGAIWMQMSTVAAEWTDRFADLVARHHVAFVDAPVSGSSGAAEEGELLILASVVGAVRPHVEPIFDVLAMLTGDFVPGFPLRHATKDAEFALTAAHRQRVELPLTSALLPRWYEAIAADHGDDDVASAVTAAYAAASPTDDRPKVSAT